MLHNFFDQPVNFLISALFIFLFGITITSLVLQNLGLPDPLTSLGGGIALLVLAMIYGKAAFGTVIAA